MNISSEQLNILNQYFTCFTPTSIFNLSRYLPYSPCTKLFYVGPMTPSTCIKKKQTEMDILQLNSLIHIKLTIH